MPLTGILPGHAVVLNSQSGLVNAPEQTNDGIKFRCLLNPQLVIGGMVQINERDIVKAKLDDEPVKLKKDGTAPEKKSLHRYSMTVFTD